MDFILTIVTYLYEKCTLLFDQTQVLDLIYKENLHFKIFVTSFKKFSIIKNYFV